MARSRSKSFDDSNDRPRKRSRSPSYNSLKEVLSRRLHIANLDENVRKKDLEESFGKYGKIVDLWLASYAPFYAFVTYESCKDAEEACVEMRSAYIGGCRIKTTVALPRRNYSDRPKRNFDRRYNKDDRRNYRRDDDRKSNYRRDSDRNNYRRDDKGGYRRDDRDGYRKHDNRNAFRKEDDRRDNYRDRRDRSPAPRKCRRSRSRS